MDPLPSLRLRGVGLARLIAVFVVTLTIGVPQGSTPSFAATPSGWRTNLVIDSSVQGQQLPLATVTGETAPDSTPTFTLSGSNLPLEATTVRGLSVFRGARESGRMCLKRTYTIRAGGAAEVGGFAERLVVKSRTRTSVLWRYSTANIGSPLDVDYVVTQTRDIPLPDIGVGERLIWQFTVTLDSPVTTYDETSALSLGRCAVGGRPHRVAVAIVRAD